MRRLLLATSLLAGGCCFNPMLAAFLVDVCFVNDTGQPAEMAFLGRDGKGRLFLLSIYSGPKFFPVPVRQKWFRVGPGDTLRITYDWDDLNLAYVLVRVGGITRYMRINAPCDCCYQPDSEVYHIPAELPEAPDSLLDILARY